MSEQSFRHRTFLQWCRRYLSLNMLVVGAVLVYLLFFTDNSAALAYEQNREIERLQAEIKANRDTLLYYQRLNHDLSVHPEAMERVVRENYHMQRDNEDVFVVVESES